MAEIKNDNFDLRAPKPLDKRTMTTSSGVAIPFNSVIAANAAIQYRHETLTVPVLLGEGLVEHWYEGGIEDGQLVPKMSIGLTMPGGFTVSSPLITKGNLEVTTSLDGFVKALAGNFIAVSSIVNADITSLSFTKITSKPTTLAGYGILDAQPFITAGTTGQYWRGDKSFQTLNKAAVALSNVDNTSDLNKPISTATQTALDAKQATLVSGTNIKTINGVTVLGSGNMVITGGGTIDSVPTNGSANAVSSDGVFDALTGKQATLVSATNIKTLNGLSVLGSGDLTVTGVSDIKVYTIANLRLETAPSTSIRYYTTNVGMEGVWWYDSSDSTTADNTGLVLVSTNGKRYKRIYDGINVDVKWFGVLGNGTNETTALQLAITNTSGKHLIIENITIRVYGINVAGSDRKIIGKNGIIKYIAAGAQPEIFWYISADNLALEELEFDLESLAGDPVSGTTVFYMENCDYVSIHKMKVHDNGHCAFKIVGGTNYFVTNNQIWNTDSAIFCLGGVQKILVDGNRIWGGTSEGIGIFSHSTDLLVTSHAIVTNNHVYNKTTSAAFNFSRTFNLLMSNNQVDGCYAGAYFQDSGSALAWNQISARVQVIGNNFTNVTHGLINVTTNFLVTDNKFDTVGRCAILGNGNIDASDAETIINYGINISNNKVINGSSLNEGWPIYDLKHMRNLVFSNNQITETSNSSTKCIRFYDVTGVIRDTYAPDSKLENFDTVSYGLDLSFIDNVFYDVDISPSYPLSSSQIFKWEFYGNRYKVLDTTPTSSSYYLTVSSGAGEVNTRFIRDWYIVANSSTITSLRPSWYGRRLTLQAAGTLGLTHGTNLQLVGATNASLTANQRITLRCEGTIWREEYRSLI